MLSLIIILYLFICPLHLSEKTPNCQQRLAKINYTFAYDNDPAYCTDAYYRYGGCYCKDAPKNKAYIKKVSSYYQCFKEVLKTDKSKVLLITHQAKSPVKNKVLNTALQCYDLPIDQTYFAYSPLQTTTVKIELLDKDDPKLNTQNVVSREVVEKALELCVLCAF